MPPRPPISTLFPYTTLFRSGAADPRVHAGHRDRVLYRKRALAGAVRLRSEEHTSELQSQSNLVCRLLLEKKNDSTSILRECYRSTDAAACRYGSTLVASLAQ